MESKEYYTNNFSKYPFENNAETASEFGLNVKTSEAISGKFLANAVQIAQNLVKSYGQGFNVMKEVISENSDKTFYSLKEHLNECIVEKLEMPEHWPSQDSKDGSIAKSIAYLSEQFFFIGARKRLLEYINE